ncbi:MAG: hypothetical protein EP312_08110 [Gammaproteobacteria bacterium]|nr:MAG: hypothetical protein EP312_08110 [Gammaproteobacteria bacterium]
MKRWLLSPVLATSATLLLLACLSWQSETATLDSLASQLQHTNDAGTLALPEDRVIQVFLQGQPHCPSITWLDGRWLTIHGHETLEARPGKTARHFTTQLRKLRTLHPDCTTQQWIIHGRLTPQQRSWIHAS